MLHLGIVGLPNVGKSTLFNALTSGRAVVANYPFATIEPNAGVVEVPDPRLAILTKIARPERTVPATVEFLDIAGLVAGASQGEGLGNKFLAHIREVEAIVHVIRCFVDDDVQHVMGTIDPVRDRDIVNVELGLADLVQVERRIERIARIARSGDTEAKRETTLLERLRDALAEGRPARDITPTADERRAYRELNLLTAKPVLYAANVLEEELTTLGPSLEGLQRAVDSSGESAEVVPFSAKVEMELADLSEADQRAFLATLGVTESGLDRLIHAAYHLLGLQSFFTIGDQEARAWTIRRGARALEAAGEIHSDFQRGFIRAETVGFQELVESGAWKAARDLGLIRSEGKNYVVQDGDVIFFRFNV